MSCAGSSGSAGCSSPALARDRRRRVPLPVALPLGGVAAVGGVVLAYNSLFFVYTTAACAVCRRRDLRESNEAALQIGLDLVALTTLLHFAGGAETPFIGFYLFHAIVGSVLLPSARPGWWGSRRFGLFLAGGGPRAAGHPAPLPRRRRPRRLLPRGPAASSPSCRSSFLVTLASTISIASSLANTLRLREHQLVVTQKALIQKSEDLERANAMLTERQRQLVLTEKQASLGQLVVGHRARDQQPHPVHLRQHGHPLRGVLGRPAAPRRAERDPPRPPHRAPRLSVLPEAGAHPAHRHGERRGADRRNRARPQDLRPARRGGPRRERGPERRRAVVASATTRHDPPPARRGGSRSRPPEVPREPDATRAGGGERGPERGGGDRPRRPRRRHPRAHAHGGWRPPSAALGARQRRGDPSRGERPDLRPLLHDETALRRDRPRPLHHLRHHPAAPGARSRSRARSARARRSTSSSRWTGTEPQHEPHPHPRRRQGRPELLRGAARPGPPVRGRGAERQHARVRHPRRRASSISSCSTWTCRR